jgi:hypothetical protein
MNSVKGLSKIIQIKFAKYIELTKRCIIVLLLTNFELPIVISNLNSDVIYNIRKHYEFLDGNDNIELDKTSS